MKRILALSILLTPLCQAGPGDNLPKKVPYLTFRELWSPSPFTTPAPPPPPPESAPVFPDLVLRGVAPLDGGGSLVTLFDKKTQEIIRIDTERDAKTNQDFKVVKIDYDPDARFGTVVHLTKNGQSGTIAFDDKIATTLKTSAPAKVAVPGQPPGVLPPQGGGIVPQPAAGVRQPRQRVVTPPPAAAQAPAQRKNIQRPSRR